MVASKENADLARRRRIWRLFSATKSTTKTEHVVDNCVIRIFLAIIASLGLDTRMIDISQAFLYGELSPEENIYMRLPKELGGYCVKLRKCLYGLKQSGRVFNRGMAKFLISLGFKQSIIEPCLFYLF